MTNFAESTIEQAAIDWLKELGYIYAFGPEIAFDGSVCTLVSLRDTLLPKLKPGEVRVQDEGGMQFKQKGLEKHTLKP
jgi:hypothetical protein